MAEDLALKISIEGDVSPIEKALSTMKEKVSGAMSGVRDAMGAVGIMAAGYLKGAIESAVKAQESTDQLKIKLENQGVAWDTAKGQIDKFTTGVKSMSTYTGGEAKAALDTLITRHISMAEALKMQAPLTELAAAKHISLADAANILADAENGRTRGLVAMGVITKEEVKNGISMDDILKRLNSSYKGLSEEHMKTLPGQIALMSRNFGEFKTSIGTALLPLITQVATILEKVSEKIKLIDGPTREIIAKVLLATAVIGPLIGGLGLAQKVMGILGPVVTGLGTLIGGLTLPIVAVIAGIAALTLAYVNNWGGMKDKTNEVISFIKPLIIDGFNTVIAWFKTNWPLIKEKFEEVLHGIESAYNTVLKPILVFMIQEIGKVVQWVQQNWPLIKETVQTVMNFISSLISTILNNILSFWKEHGNTIMALVKNIWDIIKTTIDTVIHVVLDVITAVMDIINGKWQGAWNKLVDAVKTIFHGAIQIVKDIIGSIGTVFEDMIKTAWNWGANLIKGFIDGISSKLNAVKDIASKVTSEVKKFLGFNSPSKEGEGQHIVEWGANMVTGFMGGIKSKIPSLQTLMSTVIQAPSFSNGVGSMALTGAGSSSVSNSNTYSITIDAKNVKEFNDVVNLMNNLKQTKRAK